MTPRGRTCSPARALGLQGGLDRHLCLGAALFGAMILMPLYFQTVRSEHAIHTGLLLIPQGIGAGLGMFLSARATERLGAGRTPLIGGLILAVATIPFVLISATTPFEVIGAAKLVRGIGIGLAIMPAMTAAFSVLSPAQVNDASARMPREAARSPTAGRDLNPATVTAMLDDLEAAEIVRRHRSTEDRRVCNVSLTPQGWDLLERKLADWQAQTVQEADADDLPLPLRSGHRSLTFG